MANNPAAPDATRLALRSLCVDNLRCLQDLPPASLEPSLTILTGPNGSGKTSFIDALSMLLEGSSPSEEARSSSDRNITVTGEFSSADENKCIKVRATYSAGRVQREVLRLVHPDFGSPPESMTIQALREAFASAGVESPGGASKAPFVEAAMEWISQRPLAELQEAWVSLPPETAAQLPRLTVFRSQDAADQPGQVRRLVSREAQRLLTTEAYAPRLDEIAAEVQEGIDPVLDSIKAMIGRYCPGIDDVSITTSFDFSRINPQVQMRLTRDTGESIDLNEAGSGLTQRVGLAIYAATLATLQGEGVEVVGTLLAYDEPDTHLDYQAQRELFEIIHEQGSLPHVQVVVATHSVNLIDTVTLQSLRHFRLENQRTRVDNPSDYGDSEEAVFIDDLVSGLGMRNSVLLSEKCFLVVEGPTEERALPILFKKMIGETLPSAGITLVNTDGVGSVRRLVEVLIRQLNRSVVVLVDGDARHSPGRINDTWLSEMRLVEGTNGFFVGAKEFEDAFDDEVWLRVAREWFPLDDGSSWQSSDFSNARVDEHGMGQALENLFSRRLRSRVSKPQIGEALARTVTDDEIPEAIRKAVSAASDISKKYYLSAEKCCGPE
ncbi:MAG: AAA family ATPase [Chloroflexi bacterium]|nr:AAA family ATPase [Chloroflexota bacterium]MYK33925.1 AAA family ATPase [Chloroflexota bacterium]